MANQKPQLTNTERFFRGLLFVSAGVFMVLRFVARDTDSFFFTYAAWGVGLVALAAMVLYLWSVFHNLDEL